jgi:hypothetical protein
MHRRLRRSLLSGFIGVAILASLAPRATAAGTSFFTTPDSSPYAAGAGTAEVVVADFNGDGRKDLAATNEFAHSVTVLLGVSGGGYTEGPGSPFAVGQRPFGIDVGDFNGDGRKDLAVANWGSDNVTILLGISGGSFSEDTSSPFAVGEGPHAVKATDFDLDGRSDLVVANGHSNSVSVLMRNGTGGFVEGPNSPWAVGEGPADLAFGDFNGDHIDDIATANSVSGNVTVLLGLAGNNQFSEAASSPIAVGDDPYGNAAGDLNSDGIADIAVAKWSTADEVVVLTAQGSGAFAAPASYGVGAQPYDVAIGDFDGDAANDMAVTNANGSNVTVLLQQGSGFAEQAGSPYNVGLYPLRVTTADLNGDGKADLVTGNEGGGSVSTLLQAEAGDTTGTSSGTCNVGPSNQSTQCTDVVIKPAAPGELAISLDRSTVSFGALDAGTTSAAIAVGDVNYSNTLANGQAWSVTVSATSLVAADGDVIGFSNLNYAPGASITPTGPVPGTGGTFSGTDTTPGSTFSNPVTLATASGTVLGSFTQSGNTATLTVPTSATPGAHNGTMQYTVTG